MKVSFNLNKLGYKLLKSIAEQYGLSVSTLLKIFIIRELEHFITEKDLHPELKLLTLEYLEGEYRKIEEMIRRNFKSFLRSHEEGYSLTNSPINKKLKRIIDLCESSPQMKIAHESYFNMLRLINTKRENIHKQKIELAKELGIHKDIEECIAEAQRIARERKEKHKDLLYMDLDELRKPICHDKPLKP